MKVLLVDDDEALRGVLKDALMAEGHNVRESGGAEDAAQKIAEFKPDVVVLESVLGGEEGLGALSLLKDADPAPEFSIVLITSMGEKVPGDDPRIRASVEKPFKIAQITGAVREVRASVAEEEAEEEAEKKATKRSSSRRRIFRRKGPDREPDHNLEDHGIVFGESYVVFEPQPEAIREFVRAFDPAKYDIMVVTTDKAKAVKEAISYADFELVPLTSSGRTGTLAVKDVGTLTARVRKFMEEKARPVVVFDTFGDLLKADGNNTPLLMLEQLSTGTRKPCTLAVSLDARPLSDKDRGILAKRMKEYVSKERFR